MPGFQACSSENGTHHLLEHIGHLQMRACWICQFRIIANKNQGIQGSCTPKPQNNLKHLTSRAAELVPICPNRHGRGQSGRPNSKRLLDDLVACETMRSGFLEKGGLELVWQGGFPVTHKNPGFKSANPTSGPLNWEPSILRVPGSTSPSAK